MEHNEEHVLLLHIGTPKTGTTALQKFLYDNAEALEKYGWCYPKEKALGDKNGIIFYDVFEEKLNQDPEDWESIWSILKGKLKNYNVILSSENIYDWDMVQLLQQVKKEYGNLKVLIYLRRQDFYIESYWNQWVKLGHYEKKLEDFITDFSKWSSIHYLDKLNQICEVIGEENLQVRVFEKGQWKGERRDLFSDLFDAIGIEPEWEDFHIAGRANERLFGNNLELKRVFNSLPGSDKNPAYQQYFMQLCQNVRGRGKTGSNEGYFSKEGRDNFLKQFEEENQIIARRFLHREDGVLFYDNNTDIPQNLSKASSFETDMVKLFALIIDQEINRIKECSINMASRGRKIAYFGAGAYCRQILQLYKLEVSALIDNDEKKKGKEILGVPIISPGDIVNWQDYLIVITCGNTGGIEEQLKSIGLRKWENYLAAQDVFFSESIY